MVEVVPFVCVDADLARGGCCICQQFTVFFLTNFTDRLCCVSGFSACAVTCLIATAAINGAVTCVRVITV